MNHIDRQPKVVAVTGSGVAGYRRGARLRMLGLLLVGAGLITLTGAGQTSGAQHKRERPNILFVLTDDQAVESLSMMQYTNGRRDWIRFNRAIVNNPLCCPSRASILTGKYSHHTHVESNYDQPQQFNDRSTIGTWLRRSGYRTGFIGKYLNEYPWDKGMSYVPPGWSRWIVPLGNQSVLYGFPLSVDGVPRDIGWQPQDYSTDLFTDYAISFIESSKRPFYLQINYSAPHPPDWPAPRHEGLYQGIPISFPPNFNEADVSDKPSFVREFSMQDPAEMAEVRRTDYRQLASVDESMKRLFDLLRSTGNLTNTIVVFTSDNGIANGEHRFDAKRCPYEECVRVPLLIRYPGRRGRMEHGLVSNVDLAPTFAAAARIDPPAVDGKSLMPILKGRRSGVRKAVLIRNKVDHGDPYNNYFTFWGVRTSRFKYVAYPGLGEFELYDLRADPFELRNRAGQARYRAIQAHLAAKLKKLRSARPR